MDIATSTLLSQRAAEDHQLVCAAVQGHQWAFAGLLERYHARVYQLVWKMVRHREDAADLTLETFGKAFCHLPNYSPHFAFSTWLTRIAVNHCIDYKRKKRAPYLSLDELSATETGAEWRNAIPCESPDPEEAVMRRQRIELVRSLMEHIPQPLGHVVEMRYFEELSYEEIAARLQIPLGTVKARLFRAKELLYELLQQPGASAYLDTTRRKSA